jgi:hypothetical protein
MYILKTPRFLLWLVVNAVIPILYGPLVDLSELLFQTLMWVGWTMAFLIFAANLVGYLKFPTWRKIYGTTIVLNLFGLVATSSLSFITAIPEIPFLMESLFELAAQSS